MVVTRNAAVGVLLAIVLLGGAVFFVGCGGLAIQPVELKEPVKVANPIELSDKPIVLDALRIDETVPIAIAQPVPIALTGPITIKLEGPSVDYEGVYVSEALMERIALNQTDSEWLLAVVGEPTSRHPMKDGTEIWKWVYRPRGTQLQMLDLLGQGQEDKPDPQPITAYVRLKDGLVVDKWRG
jgi:hypothetical protein